MVDTLVFVTVITLYTEHEKDKYVFMFHVIGNCHDVGYWNIVDQHELVATSIIRCVMKLLIHSQTSMAQPLKFGNG